MSDLTLCQYIRTWRTDESKRFSLKPAPSNVGTKHLGFASFFHAVFQIMDQRIHA